MRFGLITNDYDTSTTFRLDGVYLTARLSNLAYHMKAELKYVNTSSEVVQGKYVFPIGDIAIYNFRALIEDREVICECRPRAEAKATYEEAIEEGHAAFLSEQDEQCEDMFQISIGNVPANAPVVITLKYVGHLEAENVKGDSEFYGRVTMTLPQVLNPRYCPNADIEREYEAFEEGVTAHKYEVTFEATLSMPHEITSVYSPKDTFKVDYTSEDHRSGKVALTGAVSPDHDLQMCVNLKSELSSCVAVETGENRETGILKMPCMMIQFMPDFTKFTGKCELRTELIFVIDRSGSMAGSNMDYARDALLLFLKSIPKKCRFQIIGFGSTYAALFSEPMDYTEASLAKALEYQKSMAADMGGTEVYGALKAAIDYPLSGKGWYRKIMFLTDGDVMNANEVIGLVRSSVNKTQLFAVGIGEGASTHLVSGVAKAGRGMAVFLRDGSQLQSAVGKILNTALEPRASDVQIEVKLERKLADGKTEPVEVVVVPKQAPPILSGCFNTTYALLKTENLEGVCGNVTMKFDIGGEDQSVSLDLTQHIQSGRVVQSEANELHRLAGKCQINELTEEHNVLKSPEGKDVPDVDARRSKLREQIERLSCQLNVSSVFTAFVGVDPKKQDVKKVVVKPSPPPLPIGGPSPFQTGLMLCSPGAMGMPMACNMAMPMARAMAMPMVQSAIDQLDSFNCEMDYYVADVPEPQHRQRDTFTELVSLQQFNGSWKLDKSLADQIGIEQSRLEKEIPKEWSVSMRTAVPLDVWATALTIAYFEIAFAERRTDWNLMISKALVWLQEESEKCGAATKEAEQVCKSLLQTAKKFLQQSGVKPSQAC